MKQANQNHRHGQDAFCHLDVQHLNIDLGGTSVFQDVSFHLHCGEMVALIGPNGAGKSSLIKALLGQVPYTGSISFQRADGAETKLQIGYVPQSPSFDPGDPVSVLDLFISCISSRPVFLPVTKALRKRVSDCLARVQAAELIDRPIGALSGGELQRVLLAMALEPVPHLLLLDEPTSGVDVDGMGLLFELLDRLRQEYDLLILLSTHDFALLEPYVDKVLLLQGGILASGTPKEVLRSPAFRQVFHFDAGGGK